MSKEFGYIVEERRRGERKKHTAPTQRQFSSAPGEGKVDIYPRR